MKKQKVDTDRAELNDRISALINYYFVDAEEDGHVEWEILDELMNELKKEFERQNK